MSTSYKTKFLLILETMSNLKKPPEPLYGHWLSAHGLWLNIVTGENLTETANDLSKVLSHI